MIIEEFPAYSIVLLRQHSYLRTVRVTAAVYWTIVLKLEFSCSNKVKNKVKKPATNLST